MHSEIDSLVSKVHQNLVSYLKLSKIPEAGSHQTSVTPHATLSNDLGLRVTAENLIANCNDLLALTNKLKKMLLLSDFKQINSEVRDQSMERADMIEQEMAKIYADFSTAE